jgi:hypothetical protein
MNTEYESLATPYLLNKGHYKGQIAGRSRAKEYGLRA